MHKKGSEWSIGQVLTVVLAVVLIVLIIVGTTNNFFTPLFRKTKDIFNLVISYFAAGQAGVPGKKAVILGKERDLKFDEKAGRCYADIDGKLYGVSYNADEQIWEIYSQARGEEWENINKNIVSEEQIKLRDINKRLMDAVYSLSMNYDGKNRKLYLKADKTEIVLDDKGIIYGYGKNNGADSCFERKPGYSFTETEMGKLDIDSEFYRYCLSIRKSILNTFINVDNQELYLNFEDTEQPVPYDSSGSSLSVLWTALGEVRYGIDVSNRLWKAEPGKEWVSQINGVLLVPSSWVSEANSENYWNQKMNEKKIKEELITECENW